MVTPEVALGWLGFWRTWFCALICAKVFAPAVAVTRVGVGGSVRGRFAPEALAASLPSGGLFICCSKGDSDNTGFGTLLTVVVLITGLVTDGTVVLVCVLGETVRMAAAVVTVFAVLVTTTVLTIAVVVAVDLATDAAATGPRQVLCGTVALATPEDEVMAGFITTLLVGLLTVEFTETKAL